MVNRSACGGWQALQGQHGVCCSVTWWLCSEGILLRHCIPLNPLCVIGPGLQSLWSCAGPPQMLPGPEHPRAGNVKCVLLMKHLTWKHVWHHNWSITRIILGSTEMMFGCNGQVWYTLATDWWRHIILLRPPANISRVTGNCNVWFIIL